MIIQLSKPDLIRMILGTDKRIVKREDVEKIDDKYKAIISLNECNDSYRYWMFNETILNRLSNKELLDIYNNHLKGSLLLIQ